MITLNTLVVGIETIAKALAEVKDYGDLKQYVADTGNTTTEITQVWDAIIDAFADKWQAVLAEEPGAAGELREEYLLPHGLGWQALAQAGTRLILGYGSNGGKEPSAGLSSHSTGSARRRSGTAMPLSMTATGKPSEEEPVISLDGRTGSS